MLAQVQVGKPKRVDRHIIEQDATNSTESAPSRQPGLFLRQTDLSTVGVLSRAD